MRNRKNHGRGLLVTPKTLHWLPPYKILQPASDSGKKKKSKLVSSGVRTWGWTANELTFMFTVISGKLCTPTPNPTPRHYSPRPPRTPSLTPRFIRVHLRIFHLLLRPTYWVLLVWTHRPYWWCRRSPEDRIFCSNRYCTLALRIQNPVLSPPFAFQKLYLEIKKIVSG